MSHDDVIEQSDVEKLGCLLDFRSYCPIFS